MKEETRSELTSYERLLTSLRHREPDRVPFDFGGTMVSGINVNALRRLRLHLGLEGEPEIHDRVTQMARTGEDVARLLKTDVANAGPRPPSQPGLAPTGERHGLVGGAAGVRPTGPSKLTRSARVIVP